VACPDIVDDDGVTWVLTAVSTVQVWVVWCGILKEFDVSSIILRKKPLKRLFGEGLLNGQVEFGAQLVHADEGQERPADRFLEARHRG